MNNAETPKTSPTPSAAPKKRFIRPLLAIIGILIYAELVLQGISLFSPQAKDALSLSATTTTLEVQTGLEDEILGLRPNPVHPEHDARGFRNTTDLEEISIVALGDSQTYGFNAPPEGAWPQQLGQLADVGVYNMAFGGYGPPHHFILLEEALQMQPDLIIAAFYAGNDLYDSYTLIYDRNQLPELKSTDQGVIQAINAANASENLAAKANKYFGAGRPPVPKEGSTGYFLASRLKLYNLFRLTAYGLKRFYISARWHWSYKQTIGDKTLNTIFVPAYRLAVLDFDDPRIAEGYRISEEAILLMKTETQKRNVEFVALLIPSKEMVFSRAVAETEVSTPPKTYLDQIESEALLWQNLKQYLTEQNIFFVDTLPVLQEGLQTQAQSYPSTLDGHPNATGYRLIAEEVYRQLEAEGLLPRP